MRVLHMMGECSEFSTGRYLSTGMQVFHTSIGSRSCATPLGISRRGTLYIYIIYIHRLTLTLTLPSVGDNAEKTPHWGSYTVDNQGNMFHFLFFRSPRLAVELDHSCAGRTLTPLEPQTRFGDKLLEI